MKNATVLIAAGIIVCCITPIATTQATLHTQADTSVVAPEPGTAIGPLLETCGTVTGWHNPALNGTGVRNDTQEPKGAMLAKDDDDESRNPYIRRKESKYIRRRGHGRSTMGDKADNASRTDGAGKERKFDDDSAIQYNRDLKNDSGYNEDL